jgi:hypothetical protein
MDDGMKNPPDEKQTAKEPKSSRTDQAREAAEQYASDQRAIIKKLRKALDGNVAMALADPAVVLAMQASDLRHLVHRRVGTNNRPVHLDPYGAHLSRPHLQQRPTSDDGHRAGIAAYQLR